MKARKPKFKIKVSKSTRRRVASRKIVYRRQAKKSQRLVYLNF